MKKFLASIVLLLLSALLLWRLLPTQQEHSAQLTQLDDFLPALMEETGIPGLAIARIKNGQTVLLKTYGQADLKTGRAVTADTLFNLASVSKPVMGIVLLQLVDQGKLDLDQDINYYLPFKIDNPHTDNERITLRHLASHSSGIADYYDSDSFSHNKNSDTSLVQHLTSLLLPNGSHYQQGAMFLPYLPGTQRQYSNLGAGLAGYLVEATTGISLAQYSKESLFPSLSMDHSSWLLDDIPLETVAVPYETEQCVPYLPLCADTEMPELNEWISRYFNPPAEFINFRLYPHFGNPQYPDGGIRSSIRDMSQLMVAVINNRDHFGQPLLSEAMYHEMFSLQAESISDNQRFFWRDNSMGLVGHMGSDLGVFTAFYFDPDRKDGFIILMNRGMDAKAATAMKKIAKRLNDIE